MSRARASWPRALAALALLGTSWASQGCSQALGLEGLTFEEADASAEPDASGTPSPDADADVTPDPDAGAGGETASDGFVEPTIDIEPSYPLALGRGSVLVPRPDVPGTSYLLYDPESGSVVEHRVNVGNESFVAGDSWVWQAGWSRLVQIPRDDGAVVIGYDATSGLAEHVVIDHDGVNTSNSERVAGSPGWTELLPIEAGGVWNNLAYNGETGLYRFGPALVDDAAQGDVATGTWATNWTTLTPISIGDEVGVLKYDERTGEAEVEQLTGDADALGNTWAGDLGAGHSLLSTFDTDQGLLLLTYAAEDGTAETWWLTLDDEILVEPHESKSWRIEVTQMLPMWNGTAPYVLTYSSSTGVADLRTVLPLESPPVQVK